MCETGMCVRQCVIPDSQCWSCVKRKSIRISIYLRLLVSGSYVVLVITIHGVQRQSKPRKCIRIIASCIEAGEI